MVFMFDKIISAILHATKTHLQAQKALFCQFNQLRSDLFMTGATCLLDIQQEQRHTSPLECLDLLLHDILMKFDDRVKRSCETSLIVQIYRKTQSQRQYESKPKLWARNANSSQRGLSRSRPELNRLSPRFFLLPNLLAFKRLTKPNS